MTAGPLLEVKGLTVAFESARGTFRALDELTFAVGAGETVALVGESGSGKSLAALSILRLAPPPGRIVSGEILFRGRDGQAVDLAAAPEAALRQVRGARIGMVFQEPMTALNPALTIGAQLVEGQVVRRLDAGPPISRAEARRRALALLAEVGIAEPERRLAQYPHQLSGGLRQRVLIAMAAALEPALLIADEPTTALDVTTQAEVIRVLRRLQARTGMGLVFITHDLALASTIADRILVMYAGRIVEAGAAADLLAGPRHPYSRALLACLPGRQPPRGDGENWRPLPNLAGAPPDPGNPRAGCAFADRCPDVLDVCRRSGPPLVRLADGRLSRCILAGAP
jgi:oligopeptide/dipeptide ABC transporter ATP-binding protein